MRLSYPLLCALTVTALVAVPRITCAQPQWNGQQWLELYNDGRWYAVQPPPGYNQFGQLIQQQQPQVQQTTRTRTYTKLDDKSGMLYSDGDGLALYLEGEDGKKHYYPVYTTRDGDSTLLEIGLRNPTTDAVTQRMILRVPKAIQAVRRYYGTNEEYFKKNFPDRWRDELASFVNQDEKDSDKLDYTSWDGGKIRVKDDQVFLPINGKLKALYSEEDGTITDEHGKSLLDIDPKHVTALEEHYNAHKEDKKNNDGTIKEKGWGSLPENDPRRKQIEKFLASKQLAKARERQGLPATGPTGGSAVASSENKFCSNPVDAICNAAYKGTDSSPVKAEDVERINKDKETAREQLRKRAFTAAGVGIRDAIKNAKLQVTDFVDSGFDPALEPTDTEYELDKMTDDAAAYFRAMDDSQRDYANCVKGLENGTVTLGVGECNKRAKKMIALYQPYLKGLAKNMNTTESAIAENVKTNLNNVVDSGIVDGKAQIKTEIASTSYKTFNKRIEELYAGPGEVEKKAAELTKILALCGADGLSTNIIHDGSLTLCPWTVVEASDRATSAGTVDGTSADFSPTSAENIGATMAKGYSRQLEFAIREHDASGRRKVAECLAENYGKDGGITDLLKNADGEQVSATYMTKGMIEQYGAAQYLYDSIKTKKADEAIKSLANSYGLYCADWKPGATATERGKFNLSTNPTPVGDAAVITTAPKTRFGLAHGSSTDWFAERSTQAGAVPKSIADTRGVDGGPGVDKSRQPAPFAVLLEVIGLHPGIRKVMGCEKVYPKAWIDKDKDFALVTKDDKKYPKYCSPFYPNGA